MDTPYIKNEIELMGAANFRDLGGYQTASGGRTRSGVFYRADSLHHLTCEDIGRLKNLGITLQLDLRSPYEIALNPSRLESLAGVEYINISLLDGIQSDGFQNLPEDMGRMYCRLLDDNHGKLADVFRVLGSNRGGCVFSCTAGKDRTGVVAMLLLNLAGVGDDIIIDDYTRSETNMKDLLAAQREKLASDGITVPEGIFRADPAYMTSVLTHLRKWYENAFGFMKSCGIDEETITVLRNRILGD